MFINKKIIAVILVASIVLLLPADVFAQGCAMCRVAPESNLKGGGNAGQNLNKGILFLMAIPYILLVAATWYFFRKQINQKLTQMGWKK